jgi:hypothetical protein
MARGIHGLPKVLPGPAMPNLSTPCGQVTPKTVLHPSSTSLDTPRLRAWERPVCFVALKEQEEDQTKEQPRHYGLTLFNLGYNLYSNLRVLLKPPYKWPPLRQVG